MIIETYKELEFFIKMFREGNTELLIIESKGGCGKSRLVEDLMREVQHIKIHSHITPMQLFILGYKYKNLPLILDDVDALLSNEQSVALLKMFCETRKTKTVGWLSTHNLLKIQNVPQTYETQSKVLILTNDFKILTKKVGALQDRGWFIEFKPTDEELLNKINEIKGYCDIDIKNSEIEEVYDLIEKYSKFCDFSLRTFVKGLALYKQCKQIRKGGWQEILLREINLNPKLILLDNLMNKYKEDKKRIIEWEEKGFSRRSFYDYKIKFVQKCKHISKTPAQLHN